MSDARAPGQVFVARLIASQFPELNGEEVTWLSVTGATDLHRQLGWVDRAFGLEP